MVLAAVFALLCGPLLFLHNGDIHVMRAAYCDSGSILDSVLAMLPREHFYNQHAGFHSSTYGWTPNSILFLQFVGFKHILGLGPTQHFPLYGAVARINNLAFSLAALAAFFLLAQRLFVRRGQALFLTVLAACFSRFITYGYQIHPEPAALFFVLVSFHFLLNFLQAPWHRRPFFAAVFFAALGAMAKPPFGMALVCIGLAYLSVRHPIWREDIRALKDDGQTALASAGIVLGTMFTINPYLFLEFDLSQSAVAWLYRTHHTAVLIGPLANAVCWLQAVIWRDYVALIGCVAALVALFAFRRGRTPEERLVHLLALYTAGYMAWLLWFVTYPIESAYLYPVYSTLLLLSAAVGQRLGEAPDVCGRRWPRTRRLLTAGVVMAFVVQSACQCLDAACQWTAQLTMKRGAPFVARDLLLDLGQKPWRVIYFPSIPIPEGYHPWVRNVCCYPQEGAELVGVMKDVAPDAIFIDYDFWDPPRVDEYVRVADALGLQHRRDMPGGAARFGRQGCPNLASIPDCLRTIWHNIRCWTGRESGPPEESSIAIFTRL